jgi:nitrogen PTS system EIIA component
MADEDFDLESLAGYLHLEAAQLIKLAERGKLPGRKVSGQWRFSRPEINLWLEQRIGLSGEEELAQMENSLERDQAARSGADFLSVASLLAREAIEVPLAARTRNSVISSLVDVAARTGWLWDPAKMVEAVRSREDLYPTAMDSGVALLHPRRPIPALLDRPLLALGRTDRGIPFGNARGALTDIFFLVCSVSDRGHLHTLARLSRLIADADFLAQLRAAPDAPTAQALVAEREEKLLA